MSRQVLVVRPLPAAEQSAARARQLGLSPIVSPIFTICPISWTPPDQTGVDAIMLTSANAAWTAGANLEHFLNMPCYAVGGATAAAARSAGVKKVVTGPGDGAGLVAKMEADGIASAIHFCGRDRISHPSERLRIIPVPVYAAEPAEALASDAVEALRAGSIALIHSPRAGSHFRKLAVKAGFSPSALSLVAISPAAAAAAGEGWASMSIAGQPSDEALLENALRLCEEGREWQTGSSL